MLYESSHIIIKNAEAMSYIAMFKSYALKLLQLSSSLTLFGLIHMIIKFLGAMLYITRLKLHVVKLYCFARLLTIPGEFPILLKSSGSRFPFEPPNYSL